MPQEGWSVYLLEHCGEVASKIHGIIRKLHVETLNNNVLKCLISKNIMIQSLMSLNRK